MGLGPIIFYICIDRNTHIYINMILFGKRVGERFNTEVLRIVTSISLKYI